MAAKFDSIVELTDQFAQQHLNDEYAQLIRQATAALCRKRPSPLEKGQAKSWACGIAHAVGMVNFLFDSSQTPHISAKNLYGWFGVAESSGQGKSKAVRDALKMRQFDPAWCLPSRVEDNPLIWMLSVNGLIMDIRRAPLGAQVEAYTKGLIPYIPGHKEDSDALQALYVLEVALLDGPMTEAFVRKNPSVIRTIEIRGDQTLADLHRAIFNAFNREEEHLDEFQLKGAGPNDPNAERYGPTASMSDGLAGDVAKTPIGALDLVAEEVFGYWFDFGDDWWHQVNVAKITQTKAKVKYPRITNRVGASPPQYADF